MRNPSFNPHLQSLLLFDDLLPLTLLTPILFVHDFPRRPTLRAGLLGLGVHAWTQLNQLLDVFSAFALCTGLDVFAALPIALLAHSQSLMLEGFEAAHVGLLEGDL